MGEMIDLSSAEQVPSTVDAPRAATGHRPTARVVGSFVARNGIKYRFVLGTDRSDRQELRTLGPDGNAALTAVSIRGELAAEEITNGLRADLDKLPYIARDGRPYQLTVTIDSAGATVAHAFDEGLEVAAVRSPPGQPLPRLLANLREHLDHRW